MMPAEAIKTLGDFIVWVSGVGISLGVIWMWIAKPIRSMRDGLKTLQNSTDLLISDRLAQAYDHWRVKGYCPQDDKTRLMAMYDEHVGRNQNHIAKHYATKLMALPDDPPGQTEKVSM